MFQATKTGSVYATIVDEHMLGIRTPLRVFDLKSLGINAEAFIEFMRPTFSLLHVDPYDAKRNRIAFLKKCFPEAVERLDDFLIGQYSEHEDLDAIADLLAKLDRKDLHEFDRIGLTNRRKRSLARFDLRRLSPSNMWEMRRIGAKEFRQNVGPGDTRSLVRKFHETPEFVTSYPPLRRLIQLLAKMIGELRPDVKRLEMNFHQMYIFSDALTPGDNSPEGTHRDGADFIVSALVIERAGITGGESIVYAEDKKTELLRRTLMPGEGIFQDDRKLWHYVTPIKEDSSMPPEYGHRSILGFDFDIV